MRLRDKVLLTILLATSYWFLQQHVVSQNKPAAERSDNRVSLIRLQNWYVDANRDYFDNTLPKNTEVVWADLRSIDAMGDTTCNPQGCRIRLDWHTNVAPVTAHETLDHEMCHVATQGVDLMHGPEFQTCLRMLFNKGALDGLI
jgi:hypothetical protein